MNKFSKRRRNVVEQDLSDEEEQCNILQIKDSVYFYCEVSATNTLKLIECLSKATQYALENCTTINEMRVYLYIHSPGGDVNAGLSAMDHIRCNKIPVITIADGFVASAATFLLLGASERKSLENSRILIHQLSTSFWGKYTDLLDEVENSKELMTNFKSIYVSQTYMKDHEIQRLLQKELHMTSQQAMKYGIIDEIW